MESLSQTVDRLLTALESLSRAESVLLANEGWSDLAVVQERSVAIVEKLAELMSHPQAVETVDIALFTRAHALIHEQGEKIAFLFRQRAGLNDELRALDKSQQNARSLAPAYRTPDQRALSFAGQG